jgi:hypothetical protein
MLTSLSKKAIDKTFLPQVKAIKHVIYLEATLGMSKYIMLTHPPDCFMYAFEYVFAC